MNEWVWEGEDRGQAVRVKGRVKQDKKVDQTKGRWTAPETLALSPSDRVDTDMQMCSVHLHWEDACIPGQPLSPLDRAPRPHQDSHPTPGLIPLAQPPWALNSGSLVILSLSWNTVTPREVLWSQQVYIPFLFAMTSSSFSYSWCSPSFSHFTMMWCQGLLITWVEFQSVFWTLFPDHKSSFFLKGFLKLKACSVTNHPACSLLPRRLKEITSQQGYLGILRKLPQSKSKHTVVMISLLWDGNDAKPVFWNFSRGS